MQNTKVGLIPPIPMKIGDSAANLESQREEDQRRISDFECRIVDFVKGPRKKRIQIED